MNIKLLFVIASVALAYSCERKQANAISDECKTINVVYVTSSSLEETEMTYHGVLRYKTDSLIHYNLLVNDSTLFYSYNKKHGVLDLKAHILDKNYPIDNDGFPTGSFASDLIPLFINDSTYLEDIEKDTIENIHNTKRFGNVVLIEHYNNKGYDMDSIMKFISSRDFICFNKLTRDIYFEFSIGNFSIGGVSFMQKDFKKYTYPKSENCSLNKYDELIDKAIEAKPIKEGPIKERVSEIPDFQYRNLDNKLLSSKDLKQNLILLEFWYISCAPCLKNMQNLKTLYSKYGNSGVTFLVLNDLDHNVEKIKSIKQKYNLNYDLYYKGEEIKNVLDIQSHPCTIIYDNHTHKILCKFTGTGNNYTKEIGLALDSLLNY